MNYLLSLAQIHDLHVDSERDPVVADSVLGLRSSAPQLFWCCKLQREVPLNMHANKLHSSATVPANPPAVFSSQVLNTTTERPQSLHPYWVTNTKYHLLWYRSLSQTACRITEMLIILLAVFLHKHKRAHAKMFWGLISMSLWSGVAYPLEFCLLNHTHTCRLTHKRTHSRVTCSGLEIGGGCRFMVGSLAHSLLLLLETCHGFLIWPVTCYIRVAQLCAAASKDVRANNESFRAYLSKIHPASSFIIRSALTVPSIRFIPQIKM